MLKLFKKHQTKFIYIYHYLTYFITLNIHYKEIRKMQSNEHILTDDLKSILKEGFLE